MQLRTKVFNEIVQNMTQSLLLSKTEVDDAIKNLGSIQSVVEDDLIISAYEDLGRYIVNNKPGNVLNDFLRANKEVFGASDDSYYFFEAVVDELRIQGDSSDEVLMLAPDKFRSFLLSNFS